MPDRDKVIIGLEGIIDYFFDIYRNDTDSYKCAKAQEYSDCAIDAIAMLKEQEAVKPHYNARTNWYECGACRYSMTSGMHCKSELIPAYKVGFCAKCGRKQEWE